MEFAPPANPYDVAVGPDGNVYVITSADNVVHQYSPGGVLLRSFQSPAGMALEWRIAISSTGAIYITEQYNHRVTKFQIDMTTGATQTSFGRLKSLYR
jgi:streptogramin lyase